MTFSAKPTRIMLLFKFPVTSDYFRVCHSEMVYFLQFARDQKLPGSTPGLRISEFFVELFVAYIWTDSKSIPSTTSSDQKTCFEFSIVSDNMTFSAKPTRIMLPFKFPVTSDSFRVCHSEIVYVLHPARDTGKIMEYVNG